MLQLLIKRKASLIYYSEVYDFDFDFYLKDLLTIINNMAGGIGDLYCEYFDDYENIKFNAIGGLVMGISFVCFIMTSCV